MKARSFEDKKGKLWVACCECDRGGNGQADCSCGWKSKRWDMKGCFAGDLMEKYEIMLLRAK